jgi:hydrogenase maturation protein HypF
VVGFAFDGTGYGPDGATWGGEVLVADASTARRVAHLVYVPLPGGDAAIRNPYRVALAHLVAAGIPWADDLAPVQQLDAVERELLQRQLERGFLCAATSSMGRLFDAVASLLGLRHRISFEAQAAIDLELAAERSDRTDLGYRFVVEGGLIDPTPVITSLVGDRRAGMAELVAELAVEVGDGRGLDDVVLSGGVFQNALLTSLCTDRLRRAGLNPLTHRLVPPNDGGLALGQAYIAAHRSLQEDD